MGPRVLKLRSVAEGRRKVNEALVQNARVARRMRFGEQTASRQLHVYNVWTQTFL